MKDRSIGSGFMRLWVLTDDVGAEADFSHSQPIAGVLPEVV